MITVLIGHRGVGKTTLLRRLESVFLNRTDVALKDLDGEIESRHRRSVDSIFRQLGEKEFRRFEAETFEHLYRERDPAQHLILAVGAGFEFALPEDVRTVWVRRVTDAKGRIFLDRPGLAENRTPLEIWQDRFQTRDAHYRALSHEELTLPEGGLHDSILEEQFFGRQPKTLPFALSVLPENFRSLDFFERRRHWGLKFLELRDDRLSSEQIARMQSEWPKEKLLYSIRKERVSEKPAAGAVDWPLELGLPPFSVEILSLHAREATMQATLSRFPTEPSNAILKLAVTIENFDELMQGHRWWKQDPLRRAFLPTSPDGRWQWYRQLFGPQMPVHFFREGDGSSPDQPLLWQTLVQLKWGRHFAAVLGSPVKHSWTPTFQREHFDERMVPVVAIEVGESEWSSAMPVLRELGLKYAAVTSPHKKNAFLLAKNLLTKEAEQFESVNTLVLTDQGWAGHNTDAKGLQFLFQNEFEDERPIVVWGGGGTKQMLKSLLPKAQFVSAREGLQLSHPVHLVWAVGRDRSFVWPKPAVYVQDVVDLNYSEDSPGREIALLAGSPYKSGEIMFIHQGLAQRDFWKRSM